jgi:hypothetical protein
MARPDEYNINNPQMQQWQGAIGDYMGAGMDKAWGAIDQYKNMAMDWMNPDSQINQSQRKLTTNNALDQVGLLNMVNQRNNPNVNSGILNQQNMNNQNQMMNNANLNFQNQLMQNYNTGFGAMGQIPGMTSNALSSQMGGINQMQGVAENYSQSQIADTNNMNSYNAGMGGMLGQIGMGIFGGGPA